MAVVFLDITSGDDPLGAILTTLDDSDIGKFEIGQGENELGAISFTIRRDHPDATEANLAAGNYVTVRIPLIQAGAVCGFFLDEHDDTIIARDEEGGEYLQRSGPGSLAILRNAMLLNDIHVPAQVNRGNRDVPGYWTWVGEPYGAILQRLLEEGRLEPGAPLGDVTDDFNRQTDSDGLAWPDINDTIQVPIGTDGLSAYHTLVQSGQLFVRIDPDLFLHAYKTRGLDLTGASYASDVVRFVKGENILTDLSRKGHGSRAATHALVEGSDKTYRQVVDPAYTTGTGRWTKVDFDESNDADLLDDVGLEEIRKRIADQQAIELEFEAGDDPTNGRYFPFKHFNTGDLITLDTGAAEWDYDDSSFRVVGFSIELGEASDDSTDEMEARSLRWTVEIGSSASAGGMGGSGDGKCCPSLRLCHDSTSTSYLDDFDLFDRTEASGLGISTDGHTWTQRVLSGGFTAAVSGDAGVFTGPGTEAVFETNAGGPWSAGSFEMRTIVRGFSSVFFESVSFGIRNPATQSAGVFTSFVEITNEAAQHGGQVTNVTGSETDALSAATPELDGDYNVVWEHVHGAYSRAKWWLVGTSEPSTWQVERTALLDDAPDSTWTFIARVTDETKTIDYIRFAADTVLDDFNRTDTDLATSTIGKAWTSTGGAGFEQATTNGSHAVMAFTTDRKSENYQVWSALESPPWTTGTWRMETTFEVSALSASFFDTLQWRIEDDAFTYEAALTIQLKSGVGIGSVEVGDTNGTDDSVVKDDWAINTLYRVVWEHESGSYNRAKVWEAADPEPSTWLVESVAGPEDFSTGSYFWFLSEQQTAFTQTKEFDYIIFGAQGTEVTDTCIHGGPLATSGDSMKAAPGDHEHDYVAAGGTTGQVLAKASDADWDTEWVTGGGAAAPDDATYLVTTAHVGLSAEVVVGATPGGELGGTWASPTVDSSHAGGTHAATQAAAEATAATALSGHAAAADPHTGYQKESEKGAASGYASLGADTLVPQDQLGTGVQDGTKFLRDDGTWQAVTGSVTEILDIPTAETDTTLVLAPDGAGGVEFRAEVGSSGHYEVVMVPGITFPPDPVQTVDGSDWVYGLVA